MSPVMLEFDRQLTQHDWPHKFSDGVAKGIRFALRAVVTLLVRKDKVEPGSIMALTSCA